MKAKHTSVSQLPDIQLLCIPRNTGTSKSKKPVLIQEYSMKYNVYEFHNNRTVSIDHISGNKVYKLAGIVVSEVILLTCSAYCNNRFIMKIT